MEIKTIHISSYTVLPLLCTHTVLWVKISLYFNRFNTFPFDCHIVIVGCWPFVAIISADLLQNNRGPAKCQEVSDPVFCRHFKDIKLSVSRFLAAHQHIKGHKGRSMPAQAGRRQVRSLLTVCDIDVFVFSCIGHTPLLIFIHLGLPLQTSLLLS